MTLQDERKAVAEKDTEVVMGLPHLHRLASNSRALSVGYFSGHLAGQLIGEKRAIEILKSGEAEEEFGGFGGYETEGLVAYIANWLEKQLGHGEGK